MSFILPLLRDLLFFCIQLLLVYQITTPDSYLVIPSVGISIRISESMTEQEGLAHGAWFLFGAETPMFSGNTIIAAHRFRSGKPLSESFYALNRVTVGDEIQVIWRGTHYTYDVVAVTIVGLDTEQTIARLNKKQLTLVTCTPLSTSAQRLIVIAKQREY